MLCCHMGGQLDGHIFGSLAACHCVFFAIVFVLFYVCLANKLSLSLSLSWLRRLLLMSLS